MPSSVVIIEEQAGQRRRINLTGSALPLQGAGWSGENAMSTEWNPGNPEATQHVLNPKEMPSDWDFVWRTVRLIRSPAILSNGGNITQAHDLAILMEDICRAGMLLRVTWSAGAANQSQNSARQVRIGRARTWEFKYDRPDDIEASINWEWIGRGLDQPKASSIRGTSDLSARDAAQRASDAVARTILVNAMRRRALAAANSADKFTLGQVEALAAAPLALMDQMAHSANGISNRVGRIGDIINTVRETPAAIAGRALDVANNALSTATQFLDEVSREGPETQATRNKASILTRTATYFSGAQTQTDLMTAAYLQLAEQSRHRRSGVVASAGSSRRGDQMRNEDNFQVHIPRDGETMAAIAKRFYGDADLADELSVANGLPGYTIVPPRVPLIIPVRRALDDSNRNRV